MDTPQARAEAMTFLQVLLAVKRLHLPATVVRVAQELERPVYEVAGWLCRLELKGLVRLVGWSDTEGWIVELVSLPGCR